MVPERPKGPPPIGQAFAGPATLPLRQELAASSAVATTVKHGEKLDILQTRRRFIKVRAANGIEGWTDAKQLLTSAQMDELNQLSQSAQKLPSQGTAKALELLNLHGRASRSSPSFYQIAEGTFVQVVAHRVAPRNSTDPPVQLVTPPPKSARKDRKGKEKKSSAVPPPPKPNGPAPPKNWLELSNTSEAKLRAAQEEAARRREEEKKKEPVKLEDWYLVLTPEKKAGWVLSRMVTMAIPDEVAQYAEGSRITSYFALGEAEDDGVKHKHWLWTTTKHPAAEFDFDAFRVFIWSVRHHRYETAFVGRNVTGYYPTSVHPLTLTLNQKPTRVQGFTVLVEDDGGKLIHRTYWFEPSKVRLVDEQPAQRPAQNADGVPVVVSEAKPPAGTEATPGSEGKSWTEKVKAKVNGLMHRKEAVQ